LVGPSGHVAVIPPASPVVQECQRTAVSIFTRAEPPCRSSHVQNCRVDLHTCRTAVSIFTRAEPPCRSSHVQNGRVDLHTCRTAVSIFTRAEPPCRSSHVQNRLNVSHRLRVPLTDPSTSQHVVFNPLNAKLNPIYHLLALLGAHHILHISRIRVKRENSTTKLLKFEIVCVADVCITVQQC